MKNYSKKSYKCMSGSWLPKGTAPAKTPKDVMGGVPVKLNLPKANKAKPAGKTKKFPQ